MRFEDIPGQNRLKSTAREQIGSGQWPHTTLIYGQKGAPALSFARAVATELLVNGNQNDPENTRAKAVKLIHPDLHFSFPVQGAKVTSDDVLKDWRQYVLEQPFMSLSDWSAHHGTDRGQVNINVREISNIRQKLSLKAFEGGRKILIIWGAEHLDKEGNRLLKLLEEPPDKTFIILVSEDLERILPTILSRCQSYNLRPVPEETLTEFIQEKYGIEKNIAQKAVELGDGDLSRVIAAISEKEDVIDFDTGRWLKTMKSADFEAMLGFAQEFSRWPKEQQKLIFTGALTKLRRVLKGIGQDDVIFTEVLGDPIDLEIVRDLSGSFTRIIAGIERNAHAQSLIMSESIKMWKALKRSKAPSS